MFPAQLYHIYKLSQLYGDARNAVCVGHGQHAYVLMLCVCVSISTRRLRVYEDLLLGKNSISCVHVDV